MTSEQLQAAYDAIQHCGIQCIELIPDDGAPERFVMVAHFTDTRPPERFYTLPDAQASAMSWQRMHEGKGDIL